MSQVLYSSEFWFTANTATPFWLMIGEEGFDRSEEILNALMQWDSKHTAEDKQLAAYAIPLRAGMDRNEIIEHIVETVKSALRAVVEQCFSGCQGLVKS